MHRRSTFYSGVSEDLEILCQSCGMCCDGSLFGRVVLEREEVEMARRVRLRVVGNGMSFEQPCSALAPREASSSGQSGLRACGLYADRPLSCRRFVCRLYDRHRREGGPLAPRLDAVRRVRELVADLEARGLTPADFDSDGAATRANDQAAGIFSELVARLEEDFARVE
jgi:Fe-S-cluster containining protein